MQGPSYRGRGGLDTYSVEAVPQAVKVRGDPARGDVGKSKKRPVKNQLLSVFIVSINRIKSGNDTWTRIIVF